MKIGVISDIHDNITNLLKTIKILNEQKVKRLYFCGDLTSPFTIKFFKGFKAPVKAVFGNNEGDQKNIIQRIKKYKVNFEYQEKQGKIFEDNLENFSIGVYHGDVYAITDSLVLNPKYNLLFTGHTHIFHVKNINNKIWINPGTVCGWAENLKNKPTFAVFDTKTKKAKIISIP